MMTRHSTLRITSILTIILLLPVASGEDGNNALIHGQIIEDGSPVTDTNISLQFLQGSVQTQTDSDGWYYFYADDMSSIMSIGEPLCINELIQSNPSFQVKTIGCSIWQGTPITISSNTSLSSRYISDAWINNTHSTIQYFNNYSASILVHDGGVSKQLPNIMPQNIYANLNQNVTLYLKVWANDRWEIPCGEYLLLNASLEFEVRDASSLNPALPNLIDSDFAVPSYRRDGPNCNQSTSGGPVVNGMIGMLNVTIPPPNSPGFNILPIMVMSHLHFRATLIDLNSTSSNIIIMSVQREDWDPPYTTTQGAIMLHNRFNIIWS